MMTSFMSPILQGKRKTLISHKMSTESVLAERILFYMHVYIILHDFVCGHAM